MQEIGRCLPGCSDLRTSGTVDGVSLDGCCTIDPQTGHSVLYSCGAGDAASDSKPRFVDCGDSRVCALKRVGSGGAAASYFAGCFDRRLVEVDANQHQHRNGEREGDTVGEVTARSYYPYSLSAQELGDAPSALCESYY